MQPTARYFFRGELLGPLEQRMLSLIWKCGSGTVRKIEKAERYRLVHTTVMTTLDRLFKKGLLGRSQEGPAFRYKPIVSQEDFLRPRAVHAWQSLLDAAPDSILHGASPVKDYWQLCHFQGWVSGEVSAGPPSSRKSTAHNPGQ
jgi:predicted transcriptional regulator